MAITGHQARLLETTCGEVYTRRDNYLGHIVNPNPAQGKVKVVWINFNHSSGQKVFEWVPLADLLMTASARRVINKYLKEE